MKESYKEIYKGNSIRVFNNALGCIANISIGANILPLGYGKGLSKEQVVKLAKDKIDKK